MTEQNLILNEGPIQTTNLLKETVDKLFRSKVFLLASFGFINTAMIFYLVRSPLSYEAEVRFMVNNIRADAVVTPESSNGQVLRNYVDEASIATEIQLLSSKDLLRKVVVECKLAEDKTEVSTQKAIKDLQKDLKASPVLKANMIKASYSSSDPKEAAAVLQVLADGYLQEHIRVHSSSGAYEFFNRQAQHYQQQLRELQEKQDRFHQDRNIVVLGQQKDLNLRKMVELEATLKETQSARLETEQRVRTLKTQVTSVNPRITTQARNVPNQYSVERLNTMLVEFQNRRTELLMKFRPEDRLVKQIDQQITDTKVALERANRLVSTEESTDINPVRQTLESELAKTQLNANGLRVREASLIKQISDYRSSLGSLQQATPDDEQLLRNIKEAEDAFFLYSKKREEARISEAMDRNKIANVTIVEAPRVPLIPKPKLTGSVVAGYLLCNLLVLGTALILGWTRKTVHTPRELVDLTGIPVLATYSLRALPNRPVLQVTNHSGVTQ